MKNGRETWLALAAVALSTAVLFLPTWLDGASLYFSIVEEGFPVAANYPWDRFASESLAAGRFPLWNPWQSCGNTFLANYLPAFFFLPRWMLYLSDGAGVRDFYIVARFLLGGFFLYLFLRRIGLKFSGALLGSAAFITSGYFTRYFNENYLNIDIMLGLWMLAADKLAVERKLSSALLAASAILAVVLGGHPEAALHALFLMGMWIAFRCLTGDALKPTALVPVALFVCAGTIAGTFAMAQIAPFLETLSQSANYHIPNLGRYHYELKHLASLAYPWIYGNFPYHMSIKTVPEVGAIATYASTEIKNLPPYIGFVPALFAGVALTRIRSLSPAALFFGAYFIVAVGGVFGLPPFDLFFALPPLSRLGNYKHLFPEIALCAAALAGMGLDSLTNESRLKAAQHLAGPAVALVALGLFATGLTPLALLVIPLGLLPVAVFFAADLARKSGKGNKIIEAAAVALTLYYGARYTSEYHAHDERRLLDLKDAAFVRYVAERSGDDRVISLYPPLLPTFGPLFKIADARGHDALQPAPYWNLLLDVNGLEARDLNLHYDNVGGFAPLPEMLDDPRLEPLRIRFVASPADMGGMVAVNEILRTSNARAPSKKYFHWGTWDKGADRRPVLYAHPPIAFEYESAGREWEKNLRLSAAWGNEAADPKRDGAFVVVSEESGGASKVVFARHIAPTEDSWVELSASVYPPVGAKRKVVVLPMSNNYDDHLGLGVVNDGADFMGYTLAFAGEKGVRPESASDFRKTVSVYERPPSRPMFESFADENAKSGAAVESKSIWTDEYEFRVADGQSILDAYGFGWRPGWRLFGERELKIAKIGPFAFRANIAGNKILRFVYLPWGFRLGLWFSIGATISIAIFAFVRRRFGQYSTPLRAGTPARK